MHTLAAWLCPHRRETWNHRTKGEGMCRTEAPQSSVIWGKSTGCRQTAINREGLFPSIVTHKKKDMKYITKSH